MPTNKFQCPFAGIEIKSESEMTFSGYASVFNNEDSYGDVVVPGAFGETMAKSRSTGQWPSMLSHHGGFSGSAEDMTPIGIWTDMAEDGRGLYVEGKFAPTTRGNEIYALLKMKPRPALNGLSIGYFAKEVERGVKPSDPRKLKKIDLVEISLVTNPANSKARVQSVKSSIDAAAAMSDLEDILRDVGFSKKEAMAFISEACRLRARSDSEVATLEGIKTSTERVLRLLRA